MSEVEYRPGIKAQNAIDDFTESTMRDFPRQLGIPEVIPGCEVTSLDPYGEGIATFPRYITVRIANYTVPALYRGSPILDVGDKCEVIHVREGDVYTVVATSGAGGVQFVAEMYLHHWVYDVSEAALLAYDTINDALSYAALTSGDYVLMKPGIFNEAITLVDGVIITEMVPGSTILHRTSGDTCVTCADGGYLQCKEIQCTRGAGQNPVAVDASGLGVGETSEIYYELIKTTHTGMTGAETAFGIMGGGSGTVYAYGKQTEIDITENGGGDGASCVYYAGDTFYIFSDTRVTYNSDGSGACVENVFGEGGVCYFRGHHKFSGDNGATGYNLFISDSSVTFYQWGDAEIEITGAGSAAYSLYHLEGESWIFGNLNAKAVTTAYGAFCEDPAHVRGRCYAETTGNTGFELTAGFYCGDGAVELHGDGIAVGVNGNRYGVYCAVTANMTQYNGVASGATYDLYRVNGTLRVSMVDFDTYSGTITQYYPCVDDAWIGIAGGAGARMVFDVTPAPDQIQIKDANVLVEDDSWIGLGAAAGRIEFDDQATDEILVKDAYLAIGVDPPTARTHSVGAAEMGVRGESTGNYGVYGTSTNNVGIYGNSTNNVGVVGVGPVAGVEGQSDGYAVRASTASGLVFYGFITDAVTNAIDYIHKIVHLTTGAAAALFGVGATHMLEDSAGNNQDASEVATLWATSTAGSESPLRRWTTYPAGSAGPGYMGFWTWNDLDNTARTVIPNGTGDVTGILTVQYAINESGGGTSGGVATVTPGNATDLYDDGTDVYTLTCAADGSVTVARSAGASSCDIALTMTWV